DELHRQAAILHYLGVAFVATRIVGVVVDPMRIPRDGRITEDQCVRELENLRPGRLGGWADGLWRGIAFTRCDAFAINRIEVVDRDRLTIALNGMAHCQHDERPRSRQLWHNSDHLGDAP